ncbi:hypothetical protein DespoDRAFT_01182 [Desulfobacter postgatei 2ac9]|jgi:hypothetical protein|uniref:Uncharacterized protein n=2 Tax=Desulfobacter postgatei TaxID=2293 RepID=I5B0Y5_9BACT|nr:hypothetical protein [Desulfobacter postgatei]EIM63148.1 hypothetical protein DespoDRAFT_01182 [Desulfobacter postgatei 2ac9]
MSCKKAIGIAEEMKEMFGEKINLSIYTTDSEEARKYDFRSSTNVLFEGEMMPLEIVLDKNKMKTFLSDKLS